MTNVLNYLANINEENINTMYYHYLANINYKQASTRLLVENMIYSMNIIKKIHFFIYNISAVSITSARHQQDHPST